MKSIDSRIQICLYVALVLVAIFSIGSLFWQSYPLELFSSFRAYYLLAAIGIAIACLICQFKGFSAKVPLWLALGLIAFNSVWIVPWYLPHAPQAAENRIRVLTFNINVKNREWDAIARAIRDVNPDVATIVESSPESKVELSQRLADRLPFVYRTTEGGLTILSRSPLISPQTRTFDHGTALITSLQIDQSVVELIAVHPTVPILPNWFKRRNAFLEEIAAFLQQTPQTPHILLGDFNLTLWSPYYARLIRSTKLHNTRSGFGVEPSWVEAASYARYPGWVAAPVKIPIDHILVSSEFKVLDCHSLKAANADHRMLWSDLGV